MALNAPPENLHDRRLPFATVPSEIYRICRRKYTDPLHWSKKGANRFDAPSHPYGVLYTAFDPEYALLEVLRFAPVRADPAMGRGPHESP
jgi:hypothetical protein